MLRAMTMARVINRSSTKRHGFVAPEPIPTR